MDNIKYEEERLKEIVKKRSKGRRGKQLQKQSSKIRRQFNTSET